jgi:GTP-binding protein
MNHLPKIAIVGRPNVGKSALFNRIAQKKIAIVDEAEGVTRDRLYADSDLFGIPFQVIDTGGIDPRSPALFNEHIKRQAEIAIEEADSLIMVVDGTIGVTALDKEVANVLLRTQKPVCLAVNKIDNYDRKDLIFPFYSLGIKQVIPVSATQNWQIAELLEAAVKPLPPATEQVKKDNTIHVAVVGRPNVGKSSLVNSFLEEERCIVSPIPGTTRDSVDTLIEIDGDAYTLIDTAGIRKKNKESDVVDKFAAIRTERAIERADVCLLMLDAQQGITTQEKKIARDIELAGKGCILVLNKWDLVKGFKMEHCLRGVEDDVPFLKHCPTIFISALTKRNLDKIFPLVRKVYEDASVRVTTGQLNKFIAACVKKNHPPMIQGKRLKIYYMAQVAVQPPKFVVFVNIPALMSESYKKYLYNQFREAYGFTGVPIELYLRGKEAPKNAHEKDAPDVFERIQEEIEDEEFLE